MVIVRPVAESDLPALVELAGKAGVGLTNLPKDPELLERRVAHSVASFAKIPDRPAGELYLFVMEELDSKRIIGSSAVISKVGGFEPFYEYKIETHVIESKVINVRKDIPILTLLTTHDGPAEIGMLFLDPAHRKTGRGRFLQLVRFLFVAEHPQAFESTVISEFRGVIDMHGHSPFWDALGRHFFGLDFAEADRLSVMNKKFIAELMPRHPIYIPLLPDDAQAVIGKPHPEAERAVKNLVVEGFEFAEMVDIFDAGPVYSCRRDDIRTVRDSRMAPVASIADSEIDAPAHLICTTSEFRAAMAPVQDLEAGVRIAAPVARALDVTIGDKVRYVAIPRR